MQGFIDSIADSYVTGWVKLASKNHSVLIDLLVNGDVVAKRCSANIFRPDVHAAGIGHGRYGFSIPVRDLCSRGEKFEISIQASDWASTPISAQFSLQDIHVNGGQCRCPNAHSRATEDADIRLNIDEISLTSARGWCVDKNNLDDILRIEVFIDGALFSNTLNNLPRRDLASQGISNGLGGFNCALPLEHFEPGEHVISFQTPDGNTTNRTITIDPRPAAANLNLVAQPIANLSIVVPIFNAADDLINCIDRLKEFTPDEVRILLIDDASTDNRIADILENTKGFSNFKFIKNEKNIGFTATVNRGLSETGDDDVIILNSDARVTPGWVEGMLLAAQSAPRIATVTAMSDRAGAFSAPNIGNDNALPEGLSEIAYARAFRRHSLGLYPSVPTGNGFCMLIRRACIKEIGTLDAEAFPRGYGEENDFCMRAVRSGWRNVIDDRTYVFHDRSKSFGEAKTDLMVAGRAIVDSRYPEYTKAIRVFSADEKINLARYRARAALVACQAEAQASLRILFVVSTQTGGTPQTNRDLMQGLSGEVDGWVLRCDSAKLEMSRMVDGELQIMRTHVLNEPVNPISHRSNEYDAIVSQWILGLDPDVVHIRHLGWHGLALPGIAKNLGKKVIFSFHDYYALCPTVKLLDGEGKFCGGTCTKSSGDCRPELWPEGALPQLKDQWVHVWRKRFEEALEPCDAFITTSSSARDRILKHLPGISSDRFLVIPHGRDFEFCRVSQPALPGESVRILVPGNIDAAKGLDIILALLEEDKAGLLEFHILGNIFASEEVKHPRLFAHGTYKRDEFAHKAGKIRPNVGAILSIWDETFCHTLTELWSIGVPAITLDFPTVARRVQQSGAGWVMAHADIATLYREILRVCSDRSERAKVDDALIAWQEGEGAANTIRVMAASYLAVYRDILRNEAHPLGSGTVARVAVVCPASKDLTQANASTYVRIWERTRNHVDRDITYIPMTPATLIANLRARAIDGAIIQRTAIPAFLSFELFSLLKSSSTPYLYDLDDDLLNVPEDKDTHSSYSNYAPFLKQLITKASVVTVSTNTLQKLIGRFNNNTVLLPNKLSNRLWANTPPHKDAPKSTGLNALYMGTSTHDHDLQMVLPALDAVADMYPEFRLTLIGVTSDKSVFSGRKWLSQMHPPQGMKAYNKFVPWLRNEANAFDFAIAPLVHNDFNSSKSALKILDYGALGLPVIASDVANFREVAARAPGVRLTENTLDAWHDALIHQIELGSGNAELGEQTRQWVLRNHMLEQSLPAFDELVLAMLPGLARQRKHDSARFFSKSGFSGINSKIRERLARS